MLHKSHPQHSVIMNCFNGSRYLREALDSLVHQTFEDWELIFWDNQSTDISKDILFSYKEPRFKYFYSDEHTSLGPARLNAMKVASGEWFSFLDVDDIWFPDKLEAQVACIKSNPSIGLVFSRCEYFFDVEKENAHTRGSSKILPIVKKLPGKNLATELFKGNFIPFPSLMIKKAALAELGPIPSYSHPPDYFFSLGIARLFPAASVDRALCRYRLHDANLTKSIQYEGYIESIDIVSRLSSKKDRQKNIRSNVVRFVIYLLLKRNFQQLFKNIRNISMWHLILGVCEIVRYRFRYYGF